MFSQRGISLALTLGALGLWVYSLIGADFTIGYLGIIGSFPPTLYIGFGLLVAGMGVQLASKGCDWRLMLFGTLSMVAMLWLSVPLIGGSEPNTNHALRNLGLVEYVARTGDITGNTLPYLSWSGAYILPALAVKLFGINFEPMLNYAPFIMCLLCLIPLYIFLKNTLGISRHIWVGMWAFCIADWLGDMYFASASATGFLLLLALMALITLQSLWDKNRSHAKLYAAVVAVYGLLVITHLLMSLVALCVFGAIILIKRRKGLVVISGICVALLLVWSFTGASRYTKDLIGSVGVLTSMDEIRDVGEVVTEDKAIEMVNPPSMSSTTPSGGSSLSGSKRDIADDASIKPPKLPIYATGNAIVVNPVLMFKGQILTYISGNNSHKASTLITALYSLFFVVLGIAGAIFGLWRKESRSITWLVLAVAVAPLVLLILPYGGRAIERLYMVELMPLAYFASRLCTAKRRVVIPTLCGLLLLCFPVHMIAHYGNQAYDYTSKEQLIGLDEFHGIAKDGYITSPDYPWLERDLEKFYYIPFYMFSVKDGNIGCSVGDGDKDWWFIVTRSDDGFYDLVCDAPDYVDNLERTLSHTKNVALVYGNQDFRIYKFDMAQK